jgi:hypothetical protein
MVVQINKLDFKSQKIYAGLDVRLKSSCILFCFISMNRDREYIIAAA